MLWKPTAYIVCCFLLCHSALSADSSQTEIQRFLAEAQKERDGSAKVERAFTIYLEKTGKKSTMLSMHEMMLEYDPEYRRLYAGKKVPKNYAEEEIIFEIPAKKRINEIASLVARDGNYLTPDVHAEFWTLLKKARISGQTLTDLRQRHEEQFVSYMKSFLEDGLLSLENGKTHKSKDRARMEREMLKAGTLTEIKARDNDAYIAKIAAREPVIIDGKSKAIDEAELNSLLDKMSVISGRLNRLYAEPKK